MSKWLDKQLQREEEVSHMDAEVLSIDALNAEAEIEVHLPKSQFKPSEFKPGDFWTWAADSQIWDVARRMNVSLKRLMEFNEIEDSSELEPGLKLYYPYSSQATRPKPTFDVLPETRHMHISQPSGTRKVSFGNVVGWEDLTPTGPTFPENANVDIVAIVHVPVGEESAAYYMEQLDFGNYNVNGRVDYTIGFNHTHLSEGHIEKQPQAETQKIEVALPDVADDNPSPEIAALPTTEIDLSPPKKNTNLWKSTWVPFDKPRDFTPKVASWVRDYDGKRPDRWIKSDRSYSFDGSFITANDVLVARPTEATKNGLWFGVPNDNLIPDEELYNKPVDLIHRTQIPGSRFSVSERFIAIPLAAVIAQVVRVQLWFNKNKQGKK